MYSTGMNTAHVASPLQNLSQDKVAHAAAATHSEQQIHLLERARKAELMANMAVPSLPVPTYQERPPQRRGPVPQEPCEVDSKDFSTRTRSKLTGNDSLQIPYACRTLILIAEKRSV